MVFSVGKSSYSSSCSTSNPPRSWIYHVFVSFRGDDTRNGFTDHLFASLERKGIKVFRDDKDLKRGEVISQELLKAIEESMFAIVILSPNYASSTWCLDELQNIVECSKKVQVLPVFYGVDPSAVRHQRESFEEAFKKHEDRFGRGSYKIQRWIHALTQVAAYSGWNSNNLREAKLVDDIVQHIHKSLIPKLPSCIENLVGIASRVEEVNKFIGMELNDVRFIGIWGMGGVGKTTLARVVYEAIQGNFDVTCFLANVREVFDKNGLVQVQKDLLSRLNANSGDINDLYDGKKAIRNILCNKKVLLVLDDVSHRNQLEYLAAKQDWFGLGSRVIITTRDMHLLRILGVHGTYEVEGLAQNDALHLFCLKAFKQPQPAEGYMGLSKEVVKYARGLPLALEVLGSHLCGRPIDVWHSALEQIRSCPHPEIQDALKVSYEGLNPSEKDLFLDIACFFKGMKRNEVIDILKNSGRCPIIGITILIERSLLTIEWWTDNLEMHDLIQEMGRNIVFQESPNDPGKRSRLWSQEDIDPVFVENKGTEAIQGIVLNLLEPYEARWCTEAFSKTNQLNFLILNDMKLHFGLNHFPSSLKVLHWRRCSLETLPLTNRVYEFVHIKLSHSKIEQLWHGKKILEKLKYMDLSFSNNLKQLPDFSGIPSIETLDLKGCTSLSKVHPSLLHLKKLVTLNLEDCTSLKTLPCKLEMSSLKKLILSGCSAFKNLPGFGESMKHLSMLSLQGTSIRNLPTSLGCLAGLKVLDLKDCKLLVSLPNTFHELWSLKKLYLSNCYKFRNLPEFGESMIHLSRLRLDGTAIRELPSSIGCLVSLAHLKLRYCKKLVCLPDTIVALKSLTYLSTYGCSKLGKLSVGESHRMVPRSMNWKQPQKLGLRHSILNLASLITLDISYCNLSEKSFPHDLCNLPPLLEYLYMDGNHFASVPMNISNLSKLRYLSLCSCRKLQKLPELPSSIRKLDAISCVSLETSKFNPCSLFATHGEYPPKVRDSFDMVITGSEIPAWFDHQEDGEHVSTPRDCPTSDWVGIFMCFLIIRYADPSERFHYEVKCCLDSRVGKCFKKRTLPHLKSGRPELYILFLAPSHGEISWHKNRFGLFQTAKVYRRVSDCQYPNLMDLKVVSCGSRWLDKQDIAVLKNGDQKLQYPDSEAFVSRDSEIQHVDWEDDE